MLWRGQASMHTPTLAGATLHDPRLHGRRAGTSGCPASISRCYAAGIGAYSGVRGRACVRSAEPRCVHARIEAPLPMEAPNLRRRAGTASGLRPLAPRPSPEGVGRPRPRRAAGRLPRDQRLARTGSLDMPRKQCTLTPAGRVCARRKAGEHGTWPGQAGRRRQQSVSCRAASRTSLRACAASRGHGGTWCL